MGDWKFSTGFLGGMSKFPLILINSAALHYKFIYHLPEIFNTKNANRQLCTMPATSSVQLHELSDNFSFL